MLDKIRKRLASEEGFTLIELLVVMIILGILVAIAVPAYLSFRGTAQNTAAESNVRSAIPAAEGYYQTTGSYNGLNNAQLQAQAPGVATSVKVAVLNSNQGYCLEDTDGNLTYIYIGGDPGAAVAAADKAVVEQAASCSAKDGGVAAA